MSDRSQKACGRETEGTWERNRGHTGGKGLPPRVPPPQEYPSHSRRKRRSYGPPPNECAQLADLLA